MQPLFAPSSVQLLDGDRSVLFTLADGSRHEARLIPSARARNLRLRLSPDKDLLLTVAPLPPIEILAPLPIVQAAIGNLLRNAIENSDSGTIHVDRP